MKTICLHAYRYDFTCARGRPHSWLSPHGSVGVCFGRWQLWATWTPRRQAEALDAATLDRAKLAGQESR